MMIFEFCHFLLIYLTGIHIKIKFLSLIRVDSHSQIPYLQICLLANIYLYPPNHYSWCFPSHSETCACTEWEKFESPDVHVPN